MHRPLWQQREAEERGKESIRGCFFISCSHHSPGAVFTTTCLLFSENPLRASTEEKGAVASHQRRLTASINYVLNPKNKERIRNIDRKGQQIVLIENVLFKVTTACAAYFVIPPKANRRKRHITLRTMKTRTFFNTLKPYFLSVTDGGTFLISFRKLFVQS